jgi:hypothetical protein
MISSLSLPGEKHAAMEGETPGMTFTLNSDTAELHHRLLCLDAAAPLIAPRRLRKRLKDLQDGGVRVFQIVWGA